MAYLKMTAGQFDKLMTSPLCYQIEKEYDEKSKMYSIHCDPNVAKEIKKLVDEPRQPKQES